MAQIRVKAIPLESFDSASLMATYQPINSDGLPEACFIVRIVNGGNTAVTISYDGIDDHDVLFAGSILELSTPINTRLTSQGALFSKGTIVYVKGTAGIGSIAVAGYYQPVS